MITEWKRRFPQEFYAKYGKNKDGRKRLTSNDIVEHLENGSFQKKLSRVRRQVYKTLQNKGII
jgi:hypothetical protein